MSDGRRVGPAAQGSVLTTSNLGPGPTIVSGVLTVVTYEVSAVRSVQSYMALKTWADISESGLPVDLSVSHLTGFKPGTPLWFHRIS